MSKQPLAVQERHRRLVYDVMDMIEERLNEKLTLEKVAEMVAYSPFHFHRIFKAVTGENLNNYIKRTRLERALMKTILVPEKSLSQIAIECGFTSIGDFSRSFKHYFGRNASEYRGNHALKNRKICEMDRRITERYFDTIYYNITNPDGTTRIDAKHTLKVMIKQLPAYSVIYERCIGGQDPLSDQERIYQAFERASAMTHLKSDTAAYESMNIGIPYHFPILQELVRWKYDACRTIPASLGDRDPSGKVVRKLAGGAYAVIPIEKKGGVSEFIIDVFFHEWLPESGYTLDDNRPHLELFPVSDTRQASYVGYCIPIMKRS